MKNICVLIISAVIYVTLFSSCSTNNGGKVVQESIEVDNFTGVAAAGAFDVEVTLGDAKSVVAEGPKNIVKRLQTEIQNDGTLKISLEDDESFGNFQLKVLVTVPTANKFSITDRANMDIYQSSSLSSSTFEFENLTLKTDDSGDLTGHGNFSVVNHTQTEVAGRGDLNFNVTTKTMDALITGTGSNHMRVTADQLNSTISSSGKIEIQGTATTHNIDSESSGSCLVFELDTETTNVNLSASGKVECLVQNVLDVTISGSGDVFYKGFPTITSNIAGTGSIQSAN